MNKKTFDQVCDSLVEPPLSTKDKGAHSRVIWCVRIEDSENYVTHLAAFPHPNTLKATLSLTLSLLRDEYNVSRLRRLLAAFRLWKQARCSPIVTVPYPYRYVTDLGSSCEVGGTITIHLFQEELRNYLNRTGVTG